MISLLVEGAEEVEESHESLEQVEEAAGSSTARESPATVQLGVPDVEEGRLHVVQEGRPETPAVTAPFVQQTSQPRLLSARSHLAPFSFPQVRSRVFFYWLLVTLKVTCSIFIGYQ